MEICCSANRSASGQRHHRIVGSGRSLDVYR
jgi:hypothetical protein